MECPEQPTSSDYQWGLHANLLVPPPGQQIPITWSGLGPRTGMENWGWVVEDTAPFPGGPRASSLLMGPPPFLPPASRPQLAHRPSAAVVVGPSPSWQASITWSSLLVNLPVPPRWLAGPNLPIGARPRAVIENREWAQLAREVGEEGVGRQGIEWERIIHPLPPACLH